MAWMAVVGRWHGGDTTREVFGYIVDPRQAANAGRGRVTNAGRFPAGAWDEARALRFITSAVVVDAARLSFSLCLACRVVSSRQG